MSGVEREFIIFCAGFLASRDGFNGECPFLDLAPFHGEFELTLESVEETLRDKPELAGTLQSLFEAATAAPQTAIATAIGHVSRRY